MCEALSLQTIKSTQKPLLNYHFITNIDPLEFKSNVKKLNPQNDLIKFILIIAIPCFAYLISYLKINNFTFSFNKNKSDFFLKNVLYIKFINLLLKAFFLLL